MNVTLIRKAAAIARNASTGINKATATERSSRVETAQYSTDTASYATLIELISHFTTTYLLCQEVIVNNYP